MALYRHLHGTIRADPHFDALKTAGELDTALKASDKMQIIALIVGISNHQRQELQQAYDSHYGAELKSKLKKVLSSDLEDVILGLMEPTYFYDSRQLHKAVKGMGTRESTLIDVLCTRSHEQLSSIKEAYEYEFGVPLEKDVEGDTSGDFQQLLLSILKSRNLDGVDRELAKKEARLMAGNKKEKVDPDKATWARVFGHSCPAQLELVCAEYQMVTGQIVQKGIQKIFSGDARESYLLILKAIHNMPHFFASQLFAAMKGLGTSEADLNRILVSRSEVDLLAIKEEFMRAYGKKLSDAIKSECSGNYRDALLAILEGNY